MFCYSDNENAVEEIKSMPGQSRYGINRIVESLKEAVEDGLQSILLFGVPSKLSKVFAFFHIPHCITFCCTQINFHRYIKDK